MNNWQTEFQRLPWYLWVVLAIVLLAQGTWLFIDARRHEKYPWFWGIWGLMSFPLPSVLYLIFVRKIFRSRK
jgi:hypothetical protein